MTSSIVRTAPSSVGESGEIWVAKQSALDDYLSALEGGATGPQVYISQSTNILAPWQGGYEWGGDSRSQERPFPV